MFEHWPPGVFRYLFIGQAVIPFFINVVVNIALGVLAFRGQEFVSTWAMDKGAVADSIGTCFFLPFITCLIATPIVRRHVEKGVVNRVSPNAAPQWIRLINNRLALRAAQFGFIGIVLFAGPVCGLYALLADDAIETVRFITIKAIFAGVFGFFVTPLIAFVALSERR